MFETFVSLSVSSSHESEESRGWAAGMPAQLSPQRFNLLNTLFSGRPVVQISWLFDGREGVYVCVCVWRVLTDIHSNSSMETA